MQKNSEMSKEEMLKALGITAEELREFNKSLNNGIWEQMAGYSLKKETPTTQKNWK